MGTQAILMLTDWILLNPIKLQVWVQPNTNFLL